MATGFPLERRAITRCADSGLSQIKVKAVDRQPKHPFHPGEMLLEEFLEPQGMSQAEFARRIGWTKARLNELIRGKRGITAEAALDLAEALGTSPKLWMNLQATYDLDKAAAARKLA
jgi:addiction module HigA family antidote